MPTFSFSFCLGICSLSLLQQCTLVCADEDLILTVEVVIPAGVLTVFEAQMDGDQICRPLRA